jgi:hypothetical protein
MVAKYKYDPGTFIPAVPHGSRTVDTPVFQYLRAFESSLAHWLAVASNQPDGPDGPNWMRRFSVTRACRAAVGGSLRSCP